MDQTPLKILLVGDAASFHRTLALGLRKLGHTVTVASAGSSWLNTARDIDIARRGSGKIAGLELWARLNLLLWPKMRGYDVVSVATQSFISLRPERKKVFFDRLKASNRSIFNTALGTDSLFVSECMRDDTPLRYNEYRIFGKDAPYLRESPSVAATWLSEPLAELDRHIYSNVDGAVSALWEYDVTLRRVMPPHKVAYGGIPIDTDSLQPRYLPDKIDKVRFFLGRYRDRKLEKGTDILEQAARTVVERYPDHAELVIVENRPYDEYLELLKSAHLVLDQLYSYTPATNALQAMAYGLCTVSGGAPEFYDFIGEKELHPVFHVEPDYESAVKVMEEAVTKRDELHIRGRQGREFVEKHNNYITVAARNADFWRSRLEARDAGSSLTDLSL